MKRIITWIGIALLLGAYLASAGAAAAHGDKEVVVTPLTPHPGEQITVKGGGLGVGTVEIRLVGSGVNLVLGQIKTEDDGDFEAQFTCPANLIPGSYQVQAQGPTDAASIALTVVAPAGATEAGTAMNSMAANAPMNTPVAPPVRDRPLGEVLGLIVLFGLISAVGLFFARSAREVPGRVSGAEATSETPGRVAS